MSIKRLHPPHELTEQYELLKVRVLTMLNGKAAGPVVVAFTSCEKHEGVSSVASNFASTLADDSGRKVLLMDGDLRRPTLHTMISLAHRTKKPKGLWGRRELLPEARVAGSLTLPAWQLIRAGSHLDVLLARRKFDNPGMLFAMHEFGEFLDEARRKYDFVVIDCPPIHRSSGAAILSSRADGTVLVVEAGNVRQEAIQRGVMTLEETGANVLGVVLNKRQYPIPSFIYKRI